MSAPARNPSNSRSTCDPSLKVGDLVLATQTVPLPPLPLERVCLLVVLVCYLSYSFDSFYCGLEALKNCPDKPASFDSITAAVRTYGIARGVHPKALPNDISLVLLFLGYLLVVYVFC